MDTNLVSDPSLASLETDLNHHQHDRTGYRNRSFTRQDSIRHIKSPTSITSDRDKEFYYHNITTYNRQNSPIDTIVLSPGGIRKTFSSPPLGSEIPTTILLPSARISDEFMYSLEHVLWRQLPAITWPALEDIDIYVEPIIKNNLFVCSSQSSEQLPQSSAIVNKNFIPSSSSAASSPLPRKKELSFRQQPEMISASTQTEIYQCSSIDLSNIGDDIKYIDATSSACTSRAESNRNSKYDDNVIYITQESPEFIL